MSAVVRVSPDVLRWPPIRALTRSPFFPAALQGLALFALIALVPVGLGVGRGLPMDTLLVLRKTNLATLLVWGLWWPAMIAAALIAGRAWCTVCPLELVNRLAEALARRVGWRRRSLGRVLRAGWAVVAAYLVLQLLVAGCSVHRVPHPTALLLLALLGAALLAGLVFSEPRSFCRAFCPAAALLSVYGRASPLQLDVRDPAVCAACATRDCVDPGRRFGLARRSCPSLLRPFHREPSDGCVLCLECARVCPHGNVGVGWVAAGAPARAPALLRPAEAAFVMVALGFVAHEVIGEVEGIEALFHAVPEALAVGVPAVGFGWFEALWFLVLFPLLAWGTILAFSRVLGQGGGPGRALIAAATGAAPVVAVAHLAKALAKIGSWAGWLPLALRDPRGLETLEAVRAQAVAVPTPLLEIRPLGVAMLGLAGLAAWRAWRISEVHPEALGAMRAGLLGAAALFFAVLCAWGLGA